MVSSNGSPTTSGQPEVPKPPTAEPVAPQQPDARAQAERDAEDARIARVAAAVVDALRAKTPRGTFMGIEDVDEEAEAQAERERVHRAAEKHRRDAEKARAAAAAVAAEEAKKAEQQRKAAEEAEQARLAAEKAEQQRRAAEEAERARAAAEEEERRFKEEARAAEERHYTQHPLIRRVVAADPNQSSSSRTPTATQASLYDFAAAAGLFDATEHGREMFAKYGQLDRFMEEHERLLEAGMPEYVDELRNNFADTLAIVGDAMTQEQRDRLRALRDAYTVREGYMPAPAPVPPPQTAVQQPEPPPVIDHGDVTEVEAEPEQEVPWTKDMWSSWAEHLSLPELEPIDRQELTQLDKSLEAQGVDRQYLEHYRALMHEELRRRDTEREVDAALVAYRDLYEAHDTVEALRHVDDERLGRMIRDFRDALARPPRGMEPTERMEHAEIMLRLAREELNRRYDLTESPASAAAAPVRPKAPSVGPRMERLEQKVRNAVQRLQTDLQGVKASAEALLALRGQRGRVVQDAFFEYASLAATARSDLARLSRLKDKAEALENPTAAERDAVDAIVRGYDAVLEHLEGKFQVPRFRMDQNRWVMEPLRGRLQESARAPSMPPPPTRQARAPRATRPASPPPRPPSPPSSRSADDGAPPARGFSPPPTSSSSQPHRPTPVRPEPRHRDAPWHAKSHAQQWLDDAERVLSAIPGRHFHMGESMEKQQALEETVGLLIRYNRMRRMAENTTFDVHANGLAARNELMHHLKTRLGGAPAVAGYVAKHTGILYDQFYSPHSYGQVPADKVEEAMNVIGEVRRLFPERELPIVAANQLNRAERQLSHMRQSAEVNEYMAATEPTVRDLYLRPQAASAEHLFSSSERLALRKFAETVEAFEVQLSHDNPYRARISSVLRDVKAAIIKDEDRKAAMHRPATRSANKKKTGTYKL